jgi:hypothetical protein
MLLHPLKIAPPPGVPLRQIQFVGSFPSSEGKLSHLDFILLLVYYYKMC